MPKPPVPAVDMDAHIASNTGILPAIKNKNSTTVRAIYIIYKIDAVFFTFGTSRSTVGPGLSARIM